MQSIILINSFNVRLFQINSLFLVPSELKNLSVSPKKTNEPPKKKQCTELIIKQLI